MTLQQDDEQDPKRLMEEVPLEFITADDPREGGQEEDVPEEDERGDPDRRVGQPVELEDKPRQETRGLRFSAQLAACHRAPLAN